MTRIDEPGAEILNIIEEHVTLEWRKFQPEYESRFDGVSVLHDEGQTRRPPFVAFRLASNSKRTAELLEKLDEAISSFSGEVDWTMVAHDRRPLPGRNWMICPALLVASEDAARRKGISPNDYIAAEFPLFAAAAFRDLHALENHVRRGLGLAPC